MKLITYEFHSLPLRHQSIILQPMCTALSLMHAKLPLILLGPLSAPPNLQSLPLSLVTYSSIRFVPKLNYYTLAYIVLKWRFAITEPLYTFFCQKSLHIDLFFFLSKNFFTVEAILENIVIILGNWFRGNHSSGQWNKYLNCLQQRGHVLFFLRL